MSGLLESFYNTERPEKQFTFLVGSVLSNAIIYAGVLDNMGRLSSNKILTPDVDYVFPYDNAISRRIFISGLEEISTKVVSKEDIPLNKSNIENLIDFSKAKNWNDINQLREIETQCNNIMNPGGEIPSVLD